MKFFSPNRFSHSFSRIRAFSRELGLTFLFIIYIAIYPAIVHAGFFSDIIGDITPTQVSADTNSTTDTVYGTLDAGVSTSDQNSQNMLLLTPATNPNPNPDNTDASSEVPVSDNAIVPQSAPLENGTSTNPYANTEISVYTVRAGDTLSEIANLFGVSVNTIIWANDLSQTPTLTPGETLVILPISGINYTFKKGDTLQSVVKKYNANMNDVLAYNDITLSSTINVGDTIIIPDAELGTPQVSITPSSGSSSHSGSGTTRPWKGTGIPPKSLWGAPGEEPAHNTNGPDLGNYFIRPIDHGTVTQGLHGYNAVDLAAPTGTPIHAAADGTVIIARTGGWNGGYGNYVVISHPNGTQTLYAHTSKNLVSVGEQVSQGQTIALIGQTGEATGPHVHFEIRGAKNPFATPVHF